MSQKNVSIWTSLEICSSWVCLQAATHDLRLHPTNHDWSPTMTRLTHIMVWGTGSHENETRCIISWGESKWNIGQNDTKQMWNWINISIMIKLDNTILLWHPSLASWGVASASSTRCHSQRHLVKHARWHCSIWNQYPQLLTYLWRMNECLVL